MQIKTISEKEFNNFSSNHVLKSYHQTSNYGNLMNKYGYRKEYIGIYQDRTLIGASLILIKRLTFLNYGYAPKGILIDYYNKELLKEVSAELINFYRTRSVVFLRINPEISIGEIDYKNNFITTYNSNKAIAKSLEEAQFIHHITASSFSSIIPKYNAIIKLKDYDINKVTSKNKSNILKAKKKGLEIIKGDINDIPTLFEFIKYKKNRSLEYYTDYYKAFKDNMDLFLIKINYDTYLKNIRESYEEELKNNQNLVTKLIKNNNEHNLKNKMASDRLLDTYKQGLIEATKGSQTNNGVIIAGAMVIRFDNRANIIISGYNKAYKAFVPNYLLHHEIIEYYKNTDNIKYIELNGITGKKRDKVYHGLNEFKLGFNPKAYEFIGEYDLPIMPFIYGLYNFFKK